MDPAPGEADLRAAYASIVDAYGQYMHGHWPEKSAVTKPPSQAHAQLKARLAQRPMLDCPSRRLDVQSYQASGWLRSEKRGGRWWLVTPEDHAFFSLGVVPGYTEAQRGQAYAKFIAAAGDPNHAAPI